MARVRASLRKASNATTLRRAVAAARLLAVRRLLPQRRAKDIAQRGAAVRGTELLDRLLVLGHFQGLDRQGHASGGLVDIGHLGVKSVADGETLGPLFGPVPRQVGLADERVHRRV